MKEIIYTHQQNSLDFLVDKFNFNESEGHIVMEWILKDHVNVTSFSVFIFVFILFHLFK
jgi:hypothetical protein